MSGGFPPRAWTARELEVLRRLQLPPRGPDAHADAARFACSRQEIDRALWALLGKKPSEAAAELNARDGCEEAPAASGRIVRFLGQVFGGRA